MANAIAERTVDVGGVGIFMREVEGQGPPTVFVHGNPTHSADWIPFLEQVQGPALAFDLPGWGRSDRPDPLAFDGSMQAHARLVERLLDEVVGGPYQLVVHDWGGLALIAAMRRPDLVRRVVILNSVAFLPGYRWHWVARVWRRRGLGELFNATSTRRATAIVLRQARAGHRPMPKEFVDMVWEPLDAGTKRAILALYRSGDEDLLEAIGRDLPELTCPALVIWGREDPYIGAEFGRAYADALPGAELVDLADAGHWPWIDRPEVVDRVIEFVAAEPRGS